MVIGDIPLLLEPEAPGWPPGPFRMPLRTSSKPIYHSFCLISRNASARRWLQCRHRRYQEVDVIWILIVGLVAGIIARLLSPGPNKPGGFILTVVLGIAGAFLATFIGQTVGWYRADQGAGFIAATLGALLVLFIWNRLVASGTIGDPGAGPRV
jgi:uncharacterized membrane protein YeaQ/YmgE (transglycosylase-associated protein family)